MLYSVVATMSSMIYMGCLWGVVQQILIIKKRREKYTTGKASLGFATQSLSVNGFTSSFIGFYSFYVYAILMTEIDFFILVTRLLACLMTTYVLFEIYRDRLPVVERIPFQVAVFFIITSIAVLIFRDSLVHDGKKYAIALTLFATIVMFQGGLSQIVSIVRQGATGALSAKMTMVFFLKDVTNVIFGAVIGFSEGWPLMLIVRVRKKKKMINLILFTVYPQNKTIGCHSLQAIED